MPQQLVNVVSSFRVYQLHPRIILAYEKWDGNMGTHENSEGPGAMALSAALANATDDLHSLSFSHVQPSSLVGLVAL